MIDSVEKFLKKIDLLKSETIFLIAFSGGYDSSCLLDVMVHLSEKYGFKVAALHLNHNWRGDESLSEQQNCENAAKNYGIEFFTETLPYSKNMSEDEARSLRYDFFEKYAKKFPDAYVLTAHNANDNAETIIYRIAKGTGIWGLSGIPEFTQKNNVTYLRPLLNVKRADIELYCKNNSLIPNIDSSNSSLKYKRNFIRHKILPLFEEINPNAVSAINSLSDLALKNEIILKEKYDRVFENDYILLDEFNKLDDILKPFIIHKYCILKNLEYSKKKIEEIVEFVSNPSNKNKRYSLTKNLWLLFDDKKIFSISCYEKNNFELNLLQEGIYKLQNGAEFEIKQIENSLSFPKETDFEAVVDLSKIEYPLVLRTRRDGDFIQPFGMTGSMKLKKYLINKKIPRELRDNIMLLAKNNEILWAIGVGISNKLKVAKLPTHVLKYNKGD